MTKQNDVTDINVVKSSDEQRERVAEILALLFMGTGINATEISWKGTEKMKRTLLSKS